MELGHIIAVSLDNLPLASSRSILLQVMSEEKPTGWQTDEISPGVKRIINTGRDPWLVKELNGTVAFKRSDAGLMKVTALDFNGYPTGVAGAADKIALQSKTMYYLISR